MPILRPTISMTPHAPACRESFIRDRGTKKPYLRTLSQRYASTLRQRFNCIYMIRNRRPVVLLSFVHDQRTLGNSLKEVFLICFD